MRDRRSSSTPARVPALARSAYPGGAGRLRRVMLFSAALCLVGSGWTQAAAQVSGRVRDESGAPVPRAAVEIWSGGARVAAVASDSAGAFRLPADASAAAGRIVVRRFGYESLSAPFSPSGPHEYTLKALSVVLPELSASAARAPCPRRDNPAAREAWRAAASRYARDTGRRGYGLTRMVHQGWVTPEDVGFPDESRLRPGSESSVGGMARLDVVIPRSGYAWRRPPGDISYGSTLDYDAWNYPELEGTHAYHFATEEFGRFNVLAMVRTGAEGTTLAFCSRVEGPSVYGTLTIGPDGSLLSAGWRFRTPRPDEQAGGEVIFAPVPAGAEPHLLPARGLFWRKGAMPGRFWQRSTVFLAWYISPGAEAPERGAPRWGATSRQ